MGRRILLLITDLEIGGTPTVVRELATRLHSPDKGVQVEVACLSKWGPVADQIRDAGVTVTALGATRGWQLPGVVRRLRRVVRKHSIDTVFSFLVHANTAAALAAKQLPGVRFLQSIQTVQRLPRWHWWVQRRIHQVADKIVVPSSAVAEVAIERCGVPTKKIIAIPNAIEPADFPRVATFLRKPIRVGFLGRLDVVKNLPLFIDVFYSLRDRYNLEGHVFGEGPMRNPIEHLIRLRGLSERVFLRGLVSRPQDALREMDVLLFPSKGEGFGLVLIEAMASGIPVIAHAQGGGVTDVVRHEHNGLLAARADHRLLADQLGRLLNDPDLRERLIANGLAAVRQRFTWDVVLPQYRELLQLPPA